ncbi:MAG: hypothetical protein KQH63_10860 [Desulfobulbaceae bacterium]|nr:hypothetical protein [Desulfobulbaceae bacterium]
MKKRTYITSLALCGMLLFCPVMSTSALAVPGQISYQGELTDDVGVSLDGSYLMRFNLYDAESGGSQLWNSPSGEEQTVSVLGGIYNIQLGAVHSLNSDIFDTNDIWLEVAIYNDDTAAWEILVPRQKLTSTGFAFKAGNAEALEGLTAGDFAEAGHDHDAEYVNESQANSITGSMIVDSNVTSADLQDGTALAEILDDDGPGSGLNADYLDNYHGSSFTLLTQDYGRYKVSTDLYEGTSTLTSKYVNEGQANSISSGMIVDSTITAADLAANSVYASEIATNAVNAAEINFPIDYTGTDANGGLLAMVNTSGGTAGNLPAALYGGTNGSAGSYNVFGVLGTAPALGTTNNALTLLPSGAAIAVAGASQDGYGVVGTSTSHYHGGVYGEGTRGYGLYGRHTDPSYTSPAVYGKNEGSGIGVLGDSYSGSAAVQGRAFSSTGTGVRGQASVSSNYGELGKAGIGVEAQGSTYAGKFIGDVGFFSGTTSVGRYDVSDYSLHMYKSDGTTSIEIDSDYNGDGRIITDELQITGGSDLSEQFDIKKISFDIQPGMVVSIDPTQPGKLEISSEAYDNKVAGIVSGAGGIKPGMMMGQRNSEADGAHPVALTGRVYCYADTANGSIQPGDLLTTSNVPGYAMKVTEHNKALGAILGKAMSPLEEGQGLVLVLVSLQ